MLLKTTLIALLLGIAAAAQAQRVIPLYAGKAPGSESWTWPEQETADKQTQARVLFNVTTPTLTAYLPAPGTANGTAVVVCPGGGFHVLALDAEGTDVARWLQAHGVAAFVLKYRLVHLTGTDPLANMGAVMADHAKFEADNAAVQPLAIADGKKALEYVHQHAAEFSIKPDRIGLMGFSAGGTLAAGVGLGYTAANRPAFLAPIYPFLGDLAKEPVPADAPPLFVAAASDDPLVPASQGELLYSKWLAARHPAELHIYTKGGHGFGLRKQGLPVDTWIERFGDWLKLEGFMGAPAAKPLPPK